MKQAVRCRPGPGAGARRAARGLRPTGPGHHRGGIRRGRLRVHAWRRRHRQLHRHRHHHRRRQPDHPQSHRELQRHLPDRRGMGVVRAGQGRSVAPTRHGAQRRQHVLRHRLRRRRDPAAGRATGLRRTASRHVGFTRRRQGRRRRRRAEHGVEVGEAVGVDGDASRRSPGSSCRGRAMQTFQIAGREDGLWLDKFAFGRQGVFFTVFDLDNGLPGQRPCRPPPPYTPPGPPIATGKPKFLGGV